MRMPNIENIHIDRFLSPSCSARAYHYQLMPRGTGPSVEGPVLRGCYVLRNYLKDKALCASPVCVNESETYYTIIALNYKPSSITNP